MKGSKVTALLCSAATASYLFAALPAHAQSANSSPGQSTESSTDTGGDIVVTAQKREESLLSVPVPVTAIQADTLVSGNQLQLRDFYTRVPGLSFQQGSRGESSLAIRGLTTDPNGTNPTVGIIVDDLPYGSSTNLGGGSAGPDLDPSELARIEVLRGPQGTLYGASTLGGLVKYVTVRPSMDRVSGRLQAGLEGVDQSDDIGYSLRGAINVPLGQAVAVRASGFIRRGPGYIDNVLTGEDDLNSLDSKGGRLALRIRPANNLDINLSAYLQNTESDGSSETSLIPGLGSFDQSRIRGSGYYRRRSQIYSADIDWNLGAVDVRSVTGYLVDDFDAVRDFTLFIPSFGPNIATDDRRGTKFSQELRLSGSISSSIDWLVGGFYTEERTAFFNEVFAITNPAAGTRGNRLLFLSSPSRYREYAGFANVTVHFTPQFDVQIGGRQGNYRITLPETLTTGGGQTGALARDDAFTYSIAPRFRASDALMLYGRLSTGYRAGGSNSVPLNSGLPTTYGPDQSTNYELGAKGRILGNRVTYDLSLYLIDWTDIQLASIVNGRGFRVNGGEARSQGVELTLTTQPWTGATLGGWFSYNDAHLTRPLPPGSLVGNPGDPLPFASRYSANLSIDQDIPLSGDTRLTLGGTFSYRSDSRGLFAGSLAARRENPELAKLDLRAALNFGNWTANVFVNNVTNARSPVLDPNIATVAVYQRPRSYGISLSRAF